MPESKIKIEASSLNEWQQLNEAIKKLPPKTLDQIERVVSEAAITCWYKQFPANNDLFIPKSLVTRIEHCENGVSIYCHGSGFFLKAHKPDKPYNYIFV